MPGPFDAARTPESRYAALGMGARQFTGIWTQRVPYRDAAVAFLPAKFYGASRFDSIWDGINREISMLLSDDRRPGSTVYNSNTFPAANSFYSFKCIQNTQEIVRLIMDGVDGSIYDATAGQKSTLFTKSAGGTAGGWKSRFLGVNTSLFFSDKVEQKKWLNPGPWQASTNVPPGTLITSGAEPGTMQMALGGITLNVVAYKSDGVSSVYLYVNPEQIPDQFPNLLGANLTMSGFATSPATGLNGNTYTVHGVPSTTLGIIVIGATIASAAYTPDNGVGTTGNGTTNGTAPTFSTTEYAITADSGQQWKCYGPAIENWGLQTPPLAPQLTQLNSTRFWKPNFTVNQWFSILDNNQNIQFAISHTGSGYTTGNSYPIWTPLAASSGEAETTDGTIIWYNAGPVGSWAGSSAFFSNPGDGIAVILDSNQNLQWVSNGSGGMSGGSAPTWATGIGSTTTDGALTWTCLGPGIALSTGSISYAFSTHAIDGSVSTASTPVTIMGGILGQTIAPGYPIQYIDLFSTFTADPQIDQIWVWRTAQDQATLILEDQVPVDASLAGTFSYWELGIPDTSTNGGGALDAEIPAPIAESNDPPPAFITAPEYHLGRIFAIIGNTVVYSGGPDTITGNGNTAWPPINQIPLQAQIIKLRSVTVQNGALMIYTTSGIFIMLGTGTPSNPFYVTQYFSKINLASYDAFDDLGPTHFLMESNLKVSSIAIEYPFNPQSGYTEIGFPIGDQFKKVTTGEISSSLYTASGTFLSWNIGSSGDTAMYVADGAVGWFRMANVAPPETGLLWCPRAEIVGGTSAVQSVETAPGVFTLLIAPASSGPILQRDQTGTVFTDNGTAYPAWDAKGVQILCSTGEVTELAWIATKSLLAGKRPVIGLLMNEIAAAPATLPWNLLQPTCGDPADLPASKTVFSDRYSCNQNNFTPKGDCCLIKFDYGTQAFGDKLLDFQIYGSKEDERKAQAGQ